MGVTGTFCLFVFFTFWLKFFDVCADSYWVANNLTIWGSMKNFFKVVADIAEDLGVYKFSLIAISVVCFFFDLYQLYASSNHFLVIIACICLVVSVLGHAELISIEGSTYGLVYLAPAFLLVLGLLSNIYPGLGSSGDFEMSAVATAFSALAPPIGAVVICLVWGIFSLLFFKR